MNDFLHLQHFLCLDKMVRMISKKFMIQAQISLKLLKVETK